MSKSHRSTPATPAPKAEPKAEPKVEPTKAAPKEASKPTDEVDVKKCLQKLTELSTDLKMRFDDHEERIKRLEGLFKKCDAPKTDPAEKTTKPESKVEPKAAPEAPKAESVKAAPVAPKPVKAEPTKATPAEPEKATRLDPVPVIVADIMAGSDKSGPGYGFKYWDARTRTWGLTPDIWKARQLSNGVYEPIWVWYAKGGIDHILSSSELEKYVP